MRSLLLSVFALLFTFAPAARALVSQSLDGSWQIVADPSDQGRAAGWSSPAQFPQAKSQTTQVPGNIFDTLTVSQWPDKKNQLAWYRLDFTPTIVVPPGDHVYLRFAGVNRKSEAWLNGTSIGAHNGAESPFELDVTSAVAWGKTNTLIVRVWSDWFGGINNHVTLVAQPAVRIVDIFAQPDLKKSDIDVDINVENNSGATQQVDLSADCAEWKPSRQVSQKALTVTAAPGASTSRMTLPVPHAHLWDLDHPFLYRVSANLGWKSPAGPRTDSYDCRIGFRDFRNVDGFFHLNGKRIFLRSLHGGGHFDPICIWATPRTMTYLGKQFGHLKEAGFNMMRFLQSTPLTEQLDQADEMGFLIYAENETSWHVSDPNQFGTTISALVRRDRNHPSLVMWGLLNETEAGSVYDKARNSLPLVRDFDTTRYVELSSGRFDHDAKTRSGSNPGSSTWDVYLGGEDPAQPAETGTMPEDLGSFRTMMGDCHPYPLYPLSWGTLMAFAHLSQNAKPVFVSETGMGSSYDGVNERTKLDQAGAPKDAYAYMWARPMAAGLEKTWTSYDLAGTYPTPGDMMADASISSAIQRAEIFSALRGNPKMAGYSLTSIYDAGGAGEGVMDVFGAFKAGHLRALREGWAPLRWCLLTNPTHIYTDQPLHIFASLATEDRLAPGDYAVTLTIRTGNRIIWTRPCTITIPTGGPMAYPVMDEDVTVPNLADGTCQLCARLNGSPNGAASAVTFYVTTRTSVPKISGPVILAGVPSPARDFLTGQGATVQDYDPNQAAGKDVILIGDGFKSDAAGWRALYGRAARGAHLVFLANSVFATPGDNLHWLALPNRGVLATNPEWLYHRDYVAKPGPLWTGLQAKLMFPEFFGTMMARVQFINDIAPPPKDTAALGIYSTMNLDGHYEYHDGLAVGTYPFHAGHLTLNAFNLLGNVGQPAPDRLLVNLVLQAQSDAAGPAEAPADLDTEWDKLGIR